MRAKTNRLLMLLVGAAISGCASQTDRSSSGGKDQYVPQKESVQIVDRPLENAPPPQPKPAPVAAAPKQEEPTPDFPITTYELPQDEEVEDLGPQEDESVSAQQDATPEQESSVGETTEYADEQAEEEPEELGPQEDESVSAAQEPAPERESSVGETTTAADEDNAEEIGELGPQADESGTVHYPEDKRAAANQVVGEPTVYPDEPAPKPQPPAQVAAVAPAAVSVSFEAEPLFSFDKYAIRADQRDKLDELVANLQGAQLESISVIGHTDRIGSDAYNQKLSQRRADAVKNYLVSKGIPADKIHTEGHGKAEPVTGDACSKQRGKKLIACLQPDRRADIDVSGSKRTN